MRTKSAVLVIITSLILPAYGKIGETLPELTKRFGNPTKADEKTYLFYLKDYYVAAEIADNGVSRIESYFSKTALDKNGEPPGNIVRGILKTNAPNVKWSEVNPAPFDADYALATPEGGLVAFLKYKGDLKIDRDVDGRKTNWVMTVFNTEGTKFTESSVLQSSAPASTAYPRAIAVEQSEKNKSSDTSGRDLSIIVSNGISNWHKCGLFQKAIVLIVSVVTACIAIPISCKLYRLLLSPLDYIVSAPLAIMAGYVIMGAIGAVVGFAVPFLFLVQSFAR